MVVLTVGYIHILGIIILGCMKITAGVGILIMDITITHIIMISILDIPHLVIIGDLSQIGDLDSDLDGGIVIGVPGDIIMNGTDGTIMEIIMERDSGIMSEEIIIKRILSIIKLKILQI